MEIIDIKSVKNIRDFSYGNIKSNKLLRSGELDNITEEDFRILYDNYNLRTIIDLRASYERSIDFNKFGVNYFSIPLIDEETPKSKLTEDEIILNFLRTMPNDKNNQKYEKLLQSKRSWSAIFDVIYNHKEGSILIFCHQGKDRTGVVSALILSLLGIDYETIKEDYLLSNELLKERTDYLYNRVVSVAKEQGLNPISKESLLANKEYLDYVFEYINNTYGKLDNFYKQVCNLDADKINTIKKTYIQ